MALQEVAKPTGGEMSEFIAPLEIPGLVNIHITMERSTMLFMGNCTKKMVIFHSYVKLPEGKKSEIMYEVSMKFPRPVYKAIY